MEESQSLWAFMQQQSGKLISQTLTHLSLTLLSMFMAIILAVPLGIWITRKKKFSGTVLGFAGILQTIPSIALLGVMIPFLGIGPRPAILALFLYALLPVIRNTYTGINGVEPSIIDAARGIGMSKWQILTKIELPLAFPVLMAGIRTATVINVGVATLAAYIAAGGLGEFIFGGIALNNSNMILAGAIPAALLAVVLDFLLSLVQKMSLKRVRLIYILLPFFLVLFSSFYFLPSKIGGRMLAGFTPEFMGRQDGYLGLKEVYQLRMETVVISDAIKYKAAFEGKLDVIDGYSTDGRLKAFDLVTLKDDRQIFPPYYAAPLVNQEALEKYPELEEILNKLAGLLNDEEMTRLNYQVDKLKQSPEKVAADFLSAHHLLNAELPGGKGVIRIGSKVFGEQYILAQMYKMLIRGNSNLDVETKTGLGGTKICFDALVNHQIDLYPEYTGTGLLVILHPVKEQLIQVKKRPDDVYSYVKKEFNRKFKMIWLKPIGFNNSYALMMRRKQAADLNIRSITDLVHYLEEN